MGQDVEVRMLPHDELFPLMLGWYDEPSQLEEAVRAVTFPRSSGRAILVVRVADEVGLATLQRAVGTLGERRAIVVCAVAERWRAAVGRLTEGDVAASLATSARTVLVEASARMAVVGALAMAKPGDAVGIVAPHAERSTMAHYLVAGLAQRERFAPALDPA
jgi:hypothetical protein